jgi:ribonuclease Z
MPSTLLVREGENATLLIHEATMADDQAELAHAKAHSTFGQAVEVARRSGTTTFSSYLDP